MSEKNNIIGSFFISVIVLVAVGLYADNNNEKYKLSNQWVVHTQNVISHAQKIFSDVQDIESSARGYVITGAEKFLIPYRKSVTDAGTSYTQLRELIKDNRSQKAVLQRLHEKILLKKAFSDSIIDARKTGGLPLTQQLIATERGEAIMNEIRSLTAYFISKENALLNNRLAVAKKEFSATNTFIIVSRSLIFLMLIAAFIIFLRHHNKRENLQKSLRESEVRIKKFLENMPVGIFVMDAKGLPYYANHKSKEILGKGIMDYNNPDQLSEIYAVYEAGTNNLYPIEKLPGLRALNGEKNIMAEDMEVLREGVRIPLRVNAVAITDSENNIEYAIAVFEDITQSREEEKALKHAKLKAEESVILKEAFLANMSHEIRTPMNAIIGFTELLLKKKPGPTENDYLHTIKTSGENLLAIINNVLDLSKIESGTMELQEKPVNIKALMVSLKHMFVGKAKKLHLVLECDNNIPETVLGDAVHITQIFINLLGNAIKFTEKGEVRMHVTNLGEVKGICRISFTVSDTGIGISDEEINFIFDRFRQAESHTSRTYGGTGLGLNIAKELTELHGGSLTATGKKGEGSVFTVIIPFIVADRKAADTEKKNGTYDPAHFTDADILLVEDNPINIKLVKGLFADIPIRLDVAVNGKEAVEKVKSKKYDLILMDIEMPEMNGYDATHTIRQELRNNIPIIAMTAHAMAGEKEKCLQMGMNDFISKPIDANLLFEKMLAAVIIK